MQHCEHNEELCRQLMFISNHYRKNKQGFYANAFRKAVHALGDLSEQIQRPIIIEDVFTPKKGMPITEENIKNTKGSKHYPVKNVGKGIAQKIFQFLQKGQIDEYALATRNKLIDKKISQGKVKSRKPNDQAILNLSKVSYIGTATAKDFVNNHGFKTVSQLKKAAKSGKIDKKGAVTFTSPAGKKVKLSNNQRMMLHYHDKLKRVPREFISMFEKTLRYLLKQEFGPPKQGSKYYDVVFGGSYRRGAKDSGDIDILVKGNAFELKQFVDLLKNWGVIFDTLSEGKHDFKGMGRCPGMKDFIFRIDIMFTNPENWNAALAHFTGNDVLNRMMRLKAQDLREWNGKKFPHGAILSQKGLLVRGSDNKATKKRVVPGGLKSERQLFEILGMRYLKPEQRGDKMR